MEREIAIIGAAYGLGGRSIETARAPQYFREKGLLERLQTLGIRYQDRGDLSPKAPDPREQDLNPRFQPTFEEFGKRLFLRVSEITQEGLFPVILGGDHSISIATVASISSRQQAMHGKEAAIGLLWVDAHADINVPESSPSHALHGMSAAVLLGKGPPPLCALGAPGDDTFCPSIRPEHLSYIGLRDLDPPEKARIRELGIQAFTMQDIDRYGIGHVITQSLRAVTTGTHGFVVSFDLDVCDPNLAPGVTTPVRGGITFRESHLIMEMAAETNKLLALEMVEYNPSLDREGMTCEVALSLIESALGKRIL